MTATLHKLTAGDGYTYYVKSVAAMDSTEKGRSSLSDYYSAKGESPGRWLGNGLAAFDSIDIGDPVTEAQMKALYGEGLHPDADKIRRQTLADQVAKGADSKAAKRAAEASARIGARYRIYHGSTKFRQTVAERFVDFNVANGEKGLAAIPDEERARIRTDVATEMFTAEYERAPLDERELSGWTARNSRNRTTAVAGFDGCCSPVKSVSALWAVAPRSIAKEIEKCHEAAVADYLSFLEKVAGYTRLGTDGVQQVETNGLTATAFTHRDSRAGDPDLHTHVVISNKVRARTADGSWRWLALDARMLYKWAVCASEHYNTRLEAHLRNRLGLHFAERPSVQNEKRPIREIVGVDSRLIERWSARSAAITKRTGALAKSFQADHGREPTPHEMFALAERATLETRQAKHEPRTEAEQRATWRHEAIAAVGGAHALSEMVHRARHPNRGPSAELDDRWISTSAKALISRVATSRATWQEAHVRAEAERIVRAANADPEHGQRIADQLVLAALSIRRSIPRRLPDQFDEPAPLRRLDGTSVYTTARSQLYTSAAVIAAEERLIAAAHQPGGHQIPDSTVAVALLEYAANNNGRSLNAGQAELVRRMATSGARLQVAIAPAGTGKTTAMKVLARAWQSEGGTIIGLAPTGAAAGVLREEIDTTTDTIDKMTHVLAQMEKAGRTGKPVQIPHWMREIDDKTLVIIDEAAMAGTENLDAAVRFILWRGGSVRMIGDDKQKSSIAAGGVIRDIAESAGAITLTQVMRFTDPAEGNASLALRDGDPAAIAFYIDNQRVHVGDIETVKNTLYTAWSRDRAAGLDSVMMAPTRELVADLNLRARTDRIAALPDSRVGAVVALADGLPASVGDVVLTRNNDRRLPISRTDYVRNGYRWTINAIHDDGSLDVTHLRSRRRVRLPASYVREYAELGYASTASSAQGITADTSHTLEDGSSSREDLYVPLTRGKRRNDAYVSTATDGDVHKALHPEVLNPLTAVDALTGILARSSAQVSATTAQRELDDPRGRLAHAAAAYTDAVGSAAEAAIGADALAVIDAGAENTWTGLTDSAAWPTLRKHLATLAVDGRDAVDDLHTAAHSPKLNRIYGALDTAADVAAVLDWRLDETGAHSSGTGPLPWQRGIPTTLQQSPTWGAYLSARSELVTALAEQVRTAASDWSLSDAPLWARPIVGEHPALLRDLAVWRAAMRVDDTDRRPTGPDRYAVVESRYQRRLDGRATRAIGDPNSAAALWAPLVDKLDPRIRLDPFWPVLADKLSLAKHAGLDVHALVGTCIDERPLPDELAAAALWWRMSRTLQPEVVADIESGDLAARHPDWLPTLHTVVPEYSDRIIADPGFARLVAVIDSADPAEWTPTQLLTVARESILAAQYDDPIRADQVATAMTWRIETLLTAPRFGNVPLPAEPVDVESAPPDPADADFGVELLDGEALPERVVIGDDVYLDPLLVLEPPADELDRFDDELELDSDRALSAFVDDLGVDITEWAPFPEVELPYPDLSIGDRIDQLGADLAAAEHHVARLWSAFHTGTSEHVAATEPMVLELAYRADAQRPYRIDALDAHERWVEADLAASAAEDAVATLRRDATTARAAGDDTTAASLELDASLQEMEAQYYRAAADSARTDADAAQVALEAFAGGRGVVTRDDVEQARLLAQELDLDVVHQARFVAERIAAQLDRAEMAGARELAAAGTLRAADATFRALAVRLERRDYAAAFATAAASDPLRMLTDTELAASIDGVRRRLSRDDYDLIGWKRPESEAEASEAAANLNHQTAAITGARTAASVEAAAENALREAYAQAAKLRHQLERTPAIRVGARSKLTAELADADRVREQRVREHQQAQTETIAASTRAADAGAHPSDWNRIEAQAQNADVQATERAAGAAAAAAKDEREHMRERITDERRAATTKLDTLLAEQARREAQTATERRIEDRVREREARDQDHRPTNVPRPDLDPALGHEIGRDL
ncbi:relaxase domain-containing protein [Antrihabitans sp. YC3-6]|uniref:Relaxase domain-containing protein n=1 Tax=Antrihabitans stalagmiti TaxID=2799499 RepID=A0A934U6W3_9NOCA|nr:MobF family relaxase [Antrihabitans stalagmiti]MBJ8342990.1 relaxase domain-containing protein [Antrihabitans stalagmiti]